MLTKFMALSFGGALFILFIFVYNLPEAVEFKSWESKGIALADVFNKITYEKIGDKEIWRMRQNHTGRPFPVSLWDDLAIIVENKKVTFLQLKEGREIAKKVDCTVCHSNGPRLIRPDPTFVLSFGEQLKIALWNFRIKNSGFINSGNNKQRHIITLRSCAKCHNSNGPRAPLSGHNMGSILFLVKQGLMPPNKKLTNVEYQNLMLELSEKL